MFRMHHPCFTLSKHACVWISRVRIQYTAGLLYLEEGQ